MTYVIIDNNGNLESLVDRSLASFEEDFDFEPHKEYLAADEIDAMARCYHCDKQNLTALADHMDDWLGELGGVDERGLFSISHSNPKGYWDWYEIGGRFDNHLPGNSVRAGYLAANLQIELPDSILTPDGDWIEPSEPLTFDSAFNSDTNSQRTWRAEVRRQLQSWPDERVVVVDRHC